MDNKYFWNNIICYDMKKKVAFFGITIGMCLLILFTYLFFDRMFIFSQVIDEAILMTICVFTLGRFYTKKEKYIEKYGRDEAYVYAFFRFHVTTMPFIYMSALHPLYAANKLDIILFLPIRIIFGGYFLLSAVILHRKTIKIFGMDNLFMYYVYFPEKSKKTESVIHSMLRHPIYSAMARISIGSGLLMGTIDSIVLGLVLPISQIFWLKLFEEKELVQRFPTYAEYIKNTNALINKPKNLFKFWKFLITPCKK